MSLLGQALVGQSYFRIDPIQDCMTGFSAYELWSKMLVGGSTSPVTRNPAWHRNLILLFGASRQYASKTVLVVPPRIDSLESQSDMNSARQWVEAFRKISIPRDAVKLTFSRSSGPGGQNVNKVNTKCTLRCPLHAPFIPLWAKQALRKNLAYAASGDSILVTSTVHRSQAQNIDECLQKLHSLVISASLENVKNETSEEQKKKVAGLQKAAKARRRQEKEYQSKKKQLRKGDWG